MGLGVFQESGYKIWYIKVRRTMIVWKGLNEVGVRSLGRGDNMGRITNIKAFGK